MSDANRITEQARGIPRWRRFALPASIVLNLFLIAVIGGHMMHSRRLGGGGEMSLARALARAQEILPPDDAAAFTAVMRRNAPKYQDAGRQLKEARTRLDSALTAETFDQAEVRQSMAQAQAAWNTFTDKISGSLIEALAGVSVEGRRKLIAQRQTERVEP
jgi:uncharacterized membrane protein